MDHLPQDDMTMFEDFINTYCDKTFSVIARLTGANDVDAIMNITSDIFAELWTEKEKTFSSSNVGLLLFKTILRHVLLFLKQQKNEDRIELLRNTLLCKEPFSVLEST